MKKKDFGDYFHDILESIDEAEEFVREMSFEDFLGDRKTTNAIIRSLEVLSMRDGSKLSLLTMKI
ncbi:hypothetical protein LCGC14_3043500 [marine sediment metagenome]|uniref:Uncharacterized protein n=1 Tax=marine sediment metagenome TaxID=412755 RepID=A0A0F8XC55_9ZZZZ